MRVDNDFPKPPEALSRAKELKQAAADLIMTKVALKEWPLTQKEEDNFKRKFDGRSLSQELQMEIVDTGELHLADLSGLGLPDPDNLLKLSGDDDPNENGT